MNLRPVNEEPTPSVPSVANTLFFAPTSRSAKLCAAWVRILAAT